MRRIGRNDTDYPTNRNKIPLKFLSKTRAATRAAIPGTFYTNDLASLLSLWKAIDAFVYCQYLLLTP